MGRRSCQAGYNLLEVMVAMLIFSTVTTALMGGWGYSIRAMEKSRHYLVASHVAESLIEKAIAQGYNQLEPGTFEDEQLMVIRSHGAEITAIYKTTHIIERLGVEGEDNKFAVKVIVNWEETNRTGEVELETIVSSAG